LLPVYAHGVPNASASGGFRLALTREGWLQPWVRLRTNEPDEDKRLEDMPTFLTLNQVSAIKPGASVLAHVETQDGQQLPALVVQRFGKGRSAALLVGDLWRWNLRRMDPTESDLEKAWRQTIRWLMAEVPGRVEVETRAAAAGSQAVEFLVRVRDEKFQPLDNAEVTLNIRTPEGQSIELTAAGSDTQAGGYVASFTPRQPGVYRLEAVATAADASEIGRRAAGWSHEPAMEEFDALTPNLSLLEKLAEQTDGQVLALDELPDFVAGLPNRKIPITEPWIYPLWHQWSVLALAVACLAGEWGLRRWKGLP
jgi:hypothetical protein